MNEAAGIDVAERERIRNGLKQYKALHGDIGDTVLRTHMMRTLNLPIDLSTLQRFLRGAHRTDDIAVHRYRLFLRKAAPPPAEDELGKALRLFLPATLTGSESLAGLKGNFRLATRAYEGDAYVFSPERLSAFAVRKKAGTNQLFSNFTPARSRFAIEVTKEPGIMRVSETILDEEPEAPSEDMPARWPIDTASTGVLVACGGRSYLMMMRSLFDARFYLLSRITKAPSAFLGYAFEPNPLLRPIYVPSHTPWQPTCEVLLVAEGQSKGKSGAAP